MLWSFVSVKRWVPSVMRLGHSREVLDGGERNWQHLWGWQPHSDGSSKSRLQLSPLQRDQVSPAHIPMCVQLSRVQYVHSCLPFTYFSNLKLLTILSNFRFMKSIYNVNSFFFHIYLKNEYIKNPFFFWNAFNFPHYMIIVFTDLLVYKGMVSIDVVQ